MNGSAGCSGLGSTMNLACGSENHSYMTQFISVSLEYNRSRLDTWANQLNRHLKKIGVSNDLSTFDLNSSVVAEFFVSLRELLYELEPRHSDLLWGGVNVLQQACRNRATHHALIKKYHFLPILTRFLGDQLIRENKIRLLTLVQELTYGIRITWQEPHNIPQLIATMVKWIGSEEKIDVINLSLIILINLCYKNNPAIYTLMSCVDIGAFMRTVMSLERTNIEVHIFKLFIILEDINGEVPQEGILDFVTTTFESVANALKNRDVVLLRHVVDFFIDVQSEQKQPAAFAEFKHYQRNIEELIKIADSMKNENEITDPECIAKLFEFLLALVQLDLPDILQLHSQLAHLALNWVQTERHVSSTGLKLLRSYVATAKGVDAEQIMQPLSNGLQVLLVTLNVLFTTLMSLSFSPRIRSDEPFLNEATLMYINALALVQELAALNQQLQPFYVQLMDNTQIHTMIAYAFYKGDADVKSLILQLTRTAEFKQTDRVAQAFKDHQPMFEYNALNNRDRISNTFAEQQLPAYTIMSVMQEEELDKLIRKFEEALANNQIANVETSDFMKLFEYKKEAMGYAEQVRLEAADKQEAHSKHQLAQMTTESTRLHEMLLHSQQCREQTTAKLRKVEENMRRTVVQLAKAEKQCTEFKNQLKASQADLQVKNNELRAGEEYDIALRKISELEVDLANKTQKNSDMYKMVEKMRDKIVDLDKKVEEKKNWVVELTQKYSKLSEEYQKLCKRNEDQLAQKEKENLDLQAELEDYKSKLNWIVEISKTKVHPVNWGNLKQF